jgi:hypothetical protein
LQFQYEQQALRTLIEKRKTLLSTTISYLHGVTQFPPCDDQFLCHFASPWWKMRSEVPVLMTGSGVHENDGLNMTWHEVNAINIIVNRHMTLSPNLLDITDAMLATVVTPKHVDRVECTFAEVSSEHPPANCIPYINSRGRDGSDIKEEAERWQKFNAPSSANS